MRRSCAPSMKSSLGNSNTKKSITKQIESESAADKAAADPQNDTILKESNHEKIVYSILWSKRMSKKHKTWEGDGIMEVSGSNCVFRNVSGEFLGSNSLKPEEIFEGSQLVIGNKEVEIQSQIKDAQLVNIKRNIEKCPTNKLPKQKIRKIDYDKVTSSVPLPKPIKSAGQLQNYPNKNQTLEKAHRIKCSEESINFRLPSPDNIVDHPDNELKRPLAVVKVADSIAKHLRPHQKDGVIFLYNCLMGFTNPGYYGAILADEMGLGKTLQCLCICHTLLKNGPFGGDRILHRILIVTPSSLIKNWNNEINKWLGAERMFAFVLDGKHKIAQYSKQDHVPFVIVSYEMFVSNSGDFDDLKFDLIICDEGHRLKNSSIKSSIALQELNIKRKIILTGTPIQNNLQEYFALIDFVNPLILGTYHEYKTKYEMPIVKSQCPSATEDHLESGEQTSNELNEITKTFILRRTQALNKKYLPKKHEYIVFVRPSDLQYMLLTKAQKIIETKKETILKDLNSLQIITILKKICNHPSLVTRTRHTNILIRYLKKLLPEWSEMGPFDSGKLELVQHFIEELNIRNEKVVLVSNHTKTLDMLQGLCEHHDVTFSRLDGTTPPSDRNSIVEKFNQNPDIGVFLLSAKAGGVGLNLCGASSLILFDNDWNPATDLQAMSRIWRDGQTREVRIYRLITSGTIEEKIFQRQIAKTSLGSTVMNQGTDNGSSMKFSTEELRDLFSVQENFEKCATHESLHCDCEGNGKNNESIPSKDGDDDDDLNAAHKTDDVQMNELTDWKHYKFPFSDQFLSESCLTSSKDSILYVFSNQTDFLN